MWVAARNEFGVKTSQPVEVIVQTPISPVTIDTQGDPVVGYPVSLSDCTAFTTEFVCF